MLKSFEWQIMEVPSIPRVVILVYPELDKTWSKYGPTDNVFNPLVIP
jgi:hypothetical protein